MQDYQPYCALSYVWGGQVVEDAIEDDLLPQNLPATIEDAISCTLALNIKCLWVDMYCIDQQEHDEKAQEIGRMDEIYSGAVVGLFATTGKDARAGLAGLGAARNTQARCQVRNHLLIEQHVLPDAIKNSKWVQRGWTYQEMLLSKRRLFFTQTGVYFECNKHHRSEGNQGSHPYADGMETQLSTRYGYAASQTTICRHIQEYTKRQLTYPSDSLKAMLGIFNHLASSENPEYHYLGIPILMDKTSSSTMAGFLKGLCWRRGSDTTNKSLRRPAFPSWSWCGWDNAPDGVSYDNSVSWAAHTRDLRIIQTDGTFSWDSIWNSISARDPTQIPHIHPDYDKEVSPQLHFEGRVVRFQTHINDRELVAPVSVSRFWGKVEVLGENSVWLDVRLERLVEYTAVLLWEASRPKRPMFLLLREVALSPECQRSGESNDIKVSAESTHCATYERVGLMQVDTQLDEQNFEALDWYTHSQWEEIIIY